MLYNDASGVEHTDSGPHNSGNKSSGQMNRRSPYSKPPDAFMCGERPKKLLLLNASCRLLSMEVHPFVQTSFPGECPLYQDDNAPIHTAKIVQEWFSEHEREVGHLDWPPQSPNVNIIEHLWGNLESKLRARFPPPSTLSALETALHEEWLHIPLQVVHNLYVSIPHNCNDEFGKITLSSAFGENVEAKLIKIAIALDNNSLNHPMDCLVAITDKLNAEALIPLALYEPLCLISDKNNEKENEIFAESADYGYYVFK
ncbi:transposable element Tcb2 transposase [Trichonephila clavipes]|nr:transposable element Tcb2 transposase [Trichonephila clavipes]